MCSIAQGHVRVYGRGCEALLTERLFLWPYFQFLCVALDITVSAK